ncbi:UNVERIFIED_CONTAM: hypothetical protein Sradi_2652000, partial [Sesamum radiatum]
SEFCFADADCILGIPLRGAEAKDELIWHYEKSGHFTVRNAYRVACDLREGVTCSQLWRPWQFIWKLKAPPKVVMFTWRCAWDALPTTANLQRRGVVLTYGCSAEKEDVMNAIFSCNFASLVWAVSGLPWKSLLCSPSSAEEWFRGVCVNWIFESRQGEAEEVITVARRTCGIPGALFGFEDNSGS